MATCTPRTLLCFVLLHLSQALDDQPPPPPPPLPDAILANGYPAETHRVQTEDGYILTMFRIPHGARPSLQRPSLPRPSQRPPVLVMHGLLSSAADWLSTGPQQGLGYILADAGYDVWIGNFRGNMYSKEHVSYSTSSKEFWDFSWHENGEFDLAAMMDHVLLRSGQRRLLYVAHSMGTTAFLVLAALRPRYNSVVSVMCALAPVAFLANMRNVLLRELAFSNKGEEWLLQALGMYELLPNTEVTSTASRKLCNDQAPTQEVCANIMFLIAGWDSEQLNRTQLPDILSYFPGGAATKQLLHYVQDFVTDRFCEWDYGVTSNIFFYGTARPPNYDLSKVTAPVALFYGENDVLSTVADMERLYEKLPNPVRKYRVPFDKFNHLDFLWAIDAKSLVYDHVIEVFKEFW